jgi:hypothetical protein
MRFTGLLFLVLFLPFALTAQSPREPYSRDWKKADSLLDKGLPASARSIVEKLYTQAQRDGQPVQALKAQLYLIRIEKQTAEDADSIAIASAERNASTSQFPYNTVWKSIAAQLYWNYYQNNRWQLYNRTRTSGITPSDFQQWDATRFVERISALYRQSVSRPAELKGIRIESFDPVLEKGTNTRNLRPTLYDLLAFRAISFFEWDENSITKPAYAFEMTDPAAFAPAAQFVRHSFKTQDTGSLHYQALLLYQDILRLHLEDATPDALIDADLQRLEFVNRTAVFSDHKALYEAALERIAKTYSTNPLSALAAYRLAVSRYEVVNRRPRTYKIGPEGNGPQQPTGDYIALKRALDSIVASHPGSEGAVLAAQRLVGLKSPDLSLQAEEAVLPQEPSKVLVRYRNINRLYLRLVKVPASRFRNQQEGSSVNAKWLQSQQAIKAFSVSLPGTEDYQQHSTEVKIDALPFGLYALVYSPDESFKAENNLLGYVVFNVTNLAVVTQNNEKGSTGYVLHRKTGEPIQGASVITWKESWTQQGYAQFEAGKPLTTAADGSFLLPTRTNSRGLSVVKGDDELHTLDYFGYSQPAGEVKSQTRAFLFTDRSIYRPGQTVYFKGIVLQQTDRMRKATVLADKAAEVVFWDANGQKVATQPLKSNEWGSFTGSFTAPSGGLTGNMRIAATIDGQGAGGADFSVEEYKRPTFRVEPDTLKEEYALNQRVTVRMQAVSYSGAQLTGATVKYRVMREARLPYWFYQWRGWQPSPQMAISQGTTQTDATGAFNVSFPTIPDPSISEESLPVFTYTVYADVTDLNGETRSGVQRVQAGYRSLEIQTDVPEKAYAWRVDSLKVRTRNLNGQFVATPVSLKIERLQQPGEVLYRKRLWEKPDQYLMSEAEFRKLFPLDEYGDESDYHTWKSAETVYEGRFTTAEGSSIRVPKVFRRNGWYQISLTANDKNGKEVVDKHWVHIWTDEQNAGAAAVPVLVMADSVRQPGDNAQARALSGFRTAAILQTMARMDGTVITARIPWDWTETPFVTFPVTEADRGGIALRYLMVKENRVYTEAADILVPWNNKDLNLTWETHRDKLKPGEGETWTIAIQGVKGDKLAAELAATLYDASLDAYRPHSWAMGGLFPSLINAPVWYTTSGFGSRGSNALGWIQSEGVPGYDKSYDALIDLQSGYYGRGRGWGHMRRGEVADPVIFSPPGVSVQAVAGVKAPPAPTAARNSKIAITGMADASMRAEEVEQAAGGSPASKTQPDPPLRKNLQETAFFFPQLQTDANGTVQLKFTMPEALTEWKLLAVAHTKDLATGYLTGTIKTQKDLMVVPGLPRFFRQGDDLQLSAKISNLSDRDLSGTATIQLVDALTGQPLDLPFRLQSGGRSFSAPKGGSTTATWTLHVPESRYEPVIVRISATAGAFTDGEENTLPVITNRMLVTETLPLWLNGTGNKQFDFSSITSQPSGTKSNYALTVEYTSNPSWYAVQALPYLMESTYENAEQVFNRYYANALASHILAKAPRVKAIFERWQQEAALSSFRSPLELNAELKSALLDETPWVLNARSEAEQRQNIARLFETSKLARDLDANARKLEDMLLPEGGFPWFKGDNRPDRYITQYILTGIGRLMNLGAIKGDGSMGRILSRALPYVDRKLQDDYAQLKKSKAKLTDQQIGPMEVQYLYFRNTVGKIPANEAVTYYTGQAAKYWPRFSPYTKGMTALALYRLDDRKTPATILQSLRETAIKKDELGTYWIDRGRSWWWYEAPIEAQSLIIEAFAEVGKDTATVDAARRWLLKQKQTQSWETTRATADACYALLRTGSNWLTSDPVVTIQLGDTTIRSTDGPQTAGTGYFKIRIAGQDIKPNMGNVSLTVQQSPQENTTVQQPSNNRSTTVQPSSWGALYYQYFDNLDNIKAAETPLKVSKQLFKERATDRGLVLDPIASAASGSTLAVGDKVVVRIEISTDRDMEYVHLKDTRASCFEPVNVLSGYRWQGGLGYYESTRDLSSNFFISYLPKGKYVFEYPLFVTHAGDFSAGLATIQCFYAPEFAAHSEGVRVSVAGR